MKEIKLQKIQLSNFKSLNIEVEFNDGATRISGKNGIGKTSIASAFYWLLSSYTSPYVPKNFALFDDRVELTHETPLAKVKAWLKVGEYDYTIEKTAEAKFTRSKGSSEWVKASSDNYTVYIDEIETLATHYNEWIEANICPVAMLPYLLNGEFFTALIDDNKNKAREILRKMYHAKDIFAIKHALSLLHVSSVATHLHQVGSVEHTSIFARHRRAAIVHHHHRYVFQNLGIVYRRIENRVEHRQQNDKQQSTTIGENQLKLVDKHLDDIVQYRDNFFH